MFVEQSGHTTLPKISSLFYWSFRHSEKTHVKTTDSNRCQTNANQPTPTKPPGGTSYTIHYNQLLTDETAVHGGNKGIFDTQQPFFTMVFMGKNEWSNVLFSPLWWHFSATCNQHCFLLFFVVHIVICLDIWHIQYKYLFTVF